MRLRACLLWAAVLIGTSTTGSPPARAELDEVHLVRQFGIGYLQLIIMQREKLVEKHAAAAGLPNLKTKWSQLGNAVPINDGLIAGSIHVGTGGAAPLLNVWERTRGSVKMHSIGMLCALPVYLVSRHPYKKVTDFKETDRISMAGAGQSIQTLYLQMALSKEIGIANFKKLNPQFVNLSHPDGLNALLSGGEVSASFLAPPFQYIALSKGMHKVLSSYDVMGGPATFIGAWSTSKFRDESPKAFKAVVAAMREATTLIQTNKRRAAEIYAADTGGKEKVEDVERQLNDPEWIYDLAPRRMMMLADFMHKAGVLKTMPKSTQDFMFPELHDLKGD